MVAPVQTKIFNGSLVTSGDLHRLDCTEHLILAHGKGSVAIQHSLLPADLWC